MGGLCGKNSHKTKQKAANSPEKEAYKPSESDVVLGNLMNMRDELFDKKKGLTLQVEKADSQIRKLIREQKPESAKNLIKCKKLYEEYLQIMEDKYIFSQKMIAEVQQKIIDKGLLEVMKNTNALLRDIQKSMDVGVIEEMVENDERSKEISQMFAKYVNKDQEEIDREYEVIEAQMEVARVPDVEIKVGNGAGKKGVVEGKDGKGKMEIEERLAELA